MYNAYPQNTMQPNSSINQQGDPFAAFMATAMRNEAEMPSLTEASAYSTSDVNGRISLGYKGRGERCYAVVIGYLFVLFFCNI